MHVKQMKQKNGRVKLAIYEGYRDGRRTRERTVLPLGYLDELEKEHEDPVSWAKEVARQMTQEKKAKYSTQTISIHPLEKIDKRTQNIKNIGSTFALLIYEALGIEQAIRNGLRSIDTKEKYDLNSVLRLLVCERIVCPGSKQESYQNKERYFFKSDFSKDQMYDSLHLLCSLKHTIVAQMNKNIAKMYKRDLSTLYYDVTNYYFEIDQEDDLRKKGVSKEHRKCPIIQMGLLQDGQAIPLSYKLFPGNTPDTLTFEPSVRELKQDTEPKRLIRIADKGLNSSFNITEAILEKDGFIFSQSLRGKKSDKKLKEWALDDSDYIHCSSRFKYKSMQGTKTIYLSKEETLDRRAKKVEIPVKYVAFWSQDYADRAAYARSEALQKTDAMLSNPSLISAQKMKGATRYIKDTSYVKETGEIASAKRFTLDTNRILEEAALDGYYLLVTSECKWQTQRIINAYHELWRIEESFKITKSYLAARPVYLRKKEHIEAHFLTCYIALTILRLLQLKTGLSIEKIKEVLSSAEGVKADANWWCFGYRTEALDTLCNTFDLQELTRKYLTKQDIRQIIAKAKRTKI